MIKKYTKFLLNFFTILFIYDVKPSAQAIFTEIYNKNIWGWGNTESVSGTGSHLSQTATIRKEISKLIKDLNIKSILDLPCGDFNWMKHVNLEKEIMYIGADIVKPLIDRNTKLFSNKSRQFLNLNALVDVVPEVDLIICRDLFVHLSYNEIKQCLRNFKKSKSKYLLTTTFTSAKRSNVDVITGHYSWRPLNLQSYPFNFGKPILIVKENCTENNGMFADKSLGLWELKDILI